MITIRLLRESDIIPAAQIVGENYSAKYAKLAAGEFQEMFGSSSIKPTYIVAEENGCVIGLAGFVDSWMDYHVCNIFWVNVSPGEQRRGIGKELITKVLELLREKKTRVDMVLLTTSSPAYYSHHFGFQVLDSFGPKKHVLMGLKLRR